MLCMLKIKRVQSCSEGLCLILVGCFICLCGPQSFCLSRVTNPFWKGRRVVTRQRLISWPSRLDLEPPLNFVAITEIYQRMCLLVTWEVIVRTRGKKERHSVGIKLMNDFFLNLFSSGSFIFPQHGPVSLKRSLLIILFTRKFSVCLLISFLFSRDILSKYNSVVTCSIANYNCSIFTGSLMHKIRVCKHFRK